jgi:hypothetical protein
MMDIEFRRTGERRYAIMVRRADRTMLEMSPAPGYDPLMPHDLLHYVVERELGLRSGIFGQIAQGGCAGTFHLTAPATTGRREAARQRRHLNKRDARLLREGKRDGLASEGAVHVCQQAWEMRRAAAVRNTVNGKPAGSEITDERLTRILARLDELSRQWASLQIGESITVDWPDGA